LVWGDRGKRKEARVWVNKEIVEHFSCYTISLDILEFTQYLISSIIGLLRKKMSGTSQATFNELQLPTDISEKLCKIQSTVRSCLMFKTLKWGPGRSGISAFSYIPSLER
jgi:hypothetical protein